MTYNYGENEKWLQLAVEEARSAATVGEVPVGAVIVHEGVVIGRGQNHVERLHDPTAHAEILAIREATAALGYERLNSAVLYVTLEPCAMCAGAIVLARLRSLVYGAIDPKAGACGSLLDIVRDTRLNHQLEVTEGILSDTCSELLRDFFRTKRGEGDRSIEQNLSERCESG